MTGVSRSRARALARLRARIRRARAVCVRAERATRLIEEDEEDEVVAQAREPVHPRHLDDEGEEVVDERAERLVDHRAPRHVRDALELRADDK